MTDTITLTGIIATDPRALVTQSGLSITSFRLASAQRRYDRVKGEWLDGDTNWYTVTAFRQLADNVLASLRKGQRVVVTGRLRVRSWESGERSGMTVEVDAEAIGHDLVWGTSSFERRVATTGQASASGASPSDGPPSGESPDDDGDSGAGSPADTGSDGSPAPGGVDGGPAESSGSPIDGRAPAGAAEWSSPSSVRADELPPPF